MPDRPLCVLCPPRTDRPPRQAETGQACPACGARLGNVLREIIDLDALLAGPPLERDERRVPVLDEHGVWLRGAHGQLITRWADPVAGGLPVGPAAAVADGSRVTGTAEARPPVSLELLDIAGDATPHVTEALAPLVRTWRDPERRMTVTVFGRPVTIGVWHRAPVFDAAGRPVLVPLGDQIGDLPPRVLLEQWVIEWRAQRSWHPRDVVQGHTAPIYAGWLLARLDWALRRHPALPDFAGEMRELADRLRTAAGQQPPDPERKPAWIQCRNDRCDARGALYQVPGEDWIECGVCGLLYTETEYDDWVARLAAFERARRRRAS